MLSDTTVGYLSKLSYRTDAERRSCLLPLSGIYWEDEIPDFHQLHQLSEDDQIQILRLFGIRLKIWEAQALSKDDQDFWDAARSQIPNFPVFHRLNPTPEELREQKEIEENATKGIMEWFEHADQANITVDEHGIEHISATFNLTKENRGQGKSQNHAKDSSATKKPWRRRMFDR